MSRLSVSDRLLDVSLFGRACSVAAWGKTRPQIEAAIAAAPDSRLRGCAAEYVGHFTKRAPTAPEWRELARRIDMLRIWSEGYEAATRANEP